MWYSGTQLMSNIVRSSLSLLVIQSVSSISSGRRGLSQTSTWTSTWRSSPLAWTWRMSTGQTILMSSIQVWSWRFIWKGRCGTYRNLLKSRLTYYFPRLGTTWYRPTYHQPSLCFWPGYHYLCSQSQYLAGNLALSSFKEIQSDCWCLECPWAWLLFSLLLQCSALSGRMFQSK